MRSVLATELGEALYRKTQGIVEPVFGHIKFNRGFDRFQRRGRSAARSEWRLISGDPQPPKLHNHRRRRSGLNARQDPTSAGPSMPHTGIPSRPRPQPNPFPDSVPGPARRPTSEG